MFTVEVYTSFGEVGVALQEGVLKIGDRVYFAIRNRREIYEMKIVEDKDNGTFALKCLDY